MSGLLDRILGWVRSLGGGDEGTDSAGQSAESDTDAAAEMGAAYKCSVCGTPVENPDEGCPLCRSTDVVPAGGDVSAFADQGGIDASSSASASAPEDDERDGEGDADADDADADDADDADDDGGALEPSKVKEVRTGDDDADAVSRLRELRAAAESEDDESTGGADE